MADIDSVHLKVTSAFVVGGEIARKGEIVEVSVTEAKSLLARGKAVLATEADAPKVAKNPLAVGATKQADESDAAPAGDDAGEPVAEAANAPKRRKGR